MKASIFTRHFAATAIASLVALSFTSGEAAAVDPEFALRDNDRVVFLGDSITEQKLYTTYIEAYAVTRFPKLKLAFANRGWGGDTAWMRMRSFPDEKVLFAAEDFLRLLSDGAGGHGEIPAFGEFLFAEGGRKLVINHHIVTVGSEAGDFDFVAV